MSAVAITGGDVVSQIRNLMYTDPVYMWGANGETITPEMIQRLKDRFVSNDHTPEYYDDKLERFRGKKAVDDVGMLNFLSNENLSAQEYISQAKQIMPAVDVNPNKVRVLFNTRNNGTPVVGICLGNGNVIMTSAEEPGLIEVPVELTRWTIAILPHFMVENPDSYLASTIIERYQAWLNMCCEAYDLRKTATSGYYDQSTKALSLMVAKKLYGSLVGTSFDSTPSITFDEIVNEFGRHFKHGYSVEDYSKLMYIISMRLYILEMFPNFVDVWGNKAVYTMDNFGVRLSAMHKSIKLYVVNNRYLDSDQVDLPLLRELFM